MWRVLQAPTILQGKYINIRLLNGSQLRCYLLFKYGYFFLNEKKQVEPQVRSAPAKVSWHRISETIEGASWIYV